MPAKVVDASVLAAWCFGEPRKQEAEELMGGSELYAPSLLAYELASIARRKATAYPQSLGVLAEALRIALSLPIQWYNVDHHAVLLLAVDNDVTTYDASYLCLAQQLKAELVTFDSRLARAASGTGA